MDSHNVDASANRPGHRRSAELDLLNESLYHLPHHKLQQAASSSCATCACQAGVLRAAVNEDVTCRLQQVTAENGRLWLLAITQHQNAVASAQAMQVMLHRRVWLRV